MTNVGTVLGWILIIQIGYSLVAALYVYLRIHGKTFKRYDRRHIYATIRGSEYHVPREVLELYMHINDPRISESKNGKPKNPKVFFAWGLALLLPRVAARTVRPFDDTSQPKF